eukprot:Rmarinus@m.29346
MFEEGFVTRARQNPRSRRASIAVGAPDARTYVSDMIPGSDGTPLVARRPSYHYPRLPSGAVLNEPTSEFVPGRGIVDSFRVDRSRTRRASIAGNASEMAFLHRKSQTSLMGETQPMAVHNTPPRPEKEPLGGSTDMSQNLPGQLQLDEADENDNDNGDTLANIDNMPASAEDAAGVVDTADSPFLGSPRTPPPTAPRGHEATGDTIGGLESRCRPPQRIFESTDIPAIEERPRRESLASIASSILDPGIAVARKYAYKWMGTTLGKGPYDPEEEEGPKLQVFLRENMAKLRDVSTQEGAVKEKHVTLKSMEDSNVIVDVTVEEEIDYHTLWSGHHLIHPDFPLLKYWEIFSFVLIMYCTIVYPYRLAFEDDGVSDQSGLWWGFDLCIDIFFMTDIILNFRTAFFIYNGDHRRLVVGKKEIAMRYLRSWFWLDLLSSFPVDLILIGQRGDSLRVFRVFRVTRISRVFRIVRIIRLFRLIRLYKLRNVVDDLEQVTWLSSYFRIGKLLFMIFLVCHFLACVWKSASTTHDGWVETFSLMLYPEEDPDDVDAWKKYTWALYWTVTTITTVGYGDILPGTENEMIVATVVQTLGAIAFAYFIGSVSSLIFNINHQDAMRKQKRDMVNHYLRSRNLSESLKGRIREYLDFRWDNTNFNEESILSELSPALRAELTIQLSYGIVTKMPLFKGASQMFIRDVVNYMRPIVLSPGELLFQEGEVGMDLFILRRGEVSVLETVEVDADGDITEEHVIATLGPGNYFGEISLLCDAKRSASVRAKTYCDLLVLNKWDFEAVVQSYPDMELKLQGVASERLEEFGEERDKLPSGAPPAIMRARKLAAKGSEPHNEVGRLSSASNDDGQTAGETHKTPRVLQSTSLMHDSPRSPLKSPAKSPAVSMSAIPGGFDAAFEGAQLSESGSKARAAFLRRATSLTGSHSSLIQSPRSPGSPKVAAMAPRSASQSRLETSTNLSQKNMEARAMDIESLCLHVEHLVQSMRTSFESEQILWKEVGRLRSENRRVREDYRTAKLDLDRLRRFQK